MANKRRHLNFRTRMYAAAYVVYSSKTPVTVKQVSEILGISKPYARQALEAWYKHGLVGFSAKTWRGNSDIHYYYMGESEMMRFSGMGYANEAMDCFKQNQAFKFKTQMNWFNVEGWQ